jgi:hypothetical protein
VLAQATGKEKAHMINCLRSQDGLDVEGIGLLSKIGLTIETINEMVEVINHMDDEVLASATPTQRLHVLRIFGRTHPMTGSISICWWSFSPSLILGWRYGCWSMWGCSTRS